MDNMHRLTKQKKEIATKKNAKAVLSVILNVLTGNPMGLIGDAKSYFGI